MLLLFTSGWGGAWPVIGARSPAAEFDFKPPLLEDPFKLLVLTLLPVVPALVTSLLTDVLIPVLPLMADTL